METSNVTGFFTDEKNIRRSPLITQLAEHIEYVLVKNKSEVNRYYLMKALSAVLKNRMIGDWLRSNAKSEEHNAKKVYYLSLEFLMGSLLGNSIINLGLYDDVYKIMKEIGFGLESIIEEEPDMGLGNGGLGRLAACFIESMATMKLPAMGYGIRYEYGIFEQDIENGYQVEKPDHWLRYGNPWEVIRPELTYRIKFNGTVRNNFTSDGKLHFEWINTEDVLAVAYDTPVPGYKNKTVNNLRLWSAKATDDFNFSEFNKGDYISAMQNKDMSEIISKVLYPNDNIPSGKLLRLKQEYFFVSATIQDIIRQFKRNNTDFKLFPEKVAIQLNDTHPAIAIPELLRILLDEENLEWDDAFEITKNTFGYTNHTVVPEALEVWPVSLMQMLLPRHMQLIFEINQRFLNEFRRKPGVTDDIIRDVSIIGEGYEKTVRMANLAIIGSHSVNGVAQLHTEILKKSLFKHFYNAEPEKFNNKTNGISQRRFLKQANPFLSKLISDKIGESWILNLSDLKKLEDLQFDDEFLENWRDSKWVNKLNLSEYVKNNYGIDLNPTSMFDCQIKRIHEYKRQLMNVLHTIHLYNRIKDNPEENILPRTVLFAGKAAPGYYMAKLIIKLINSVAEVVNNDPEVGDKLKVLFLKNYSVSLAEKIIPASDLSEQISTAGLEASGTGNMKFALNGALTIGTLDGANIEIKNEVGDENIFIFGLEAEEVERIRASGYNPRMIYENNSNLKRIIDMIASDYFNKNEPGIFRHIVDSLLYHDYYFVLADFQSYIDKQAEVESEYRNVDRWTKKSILNVARIGKFSSDRTIKEYAEEIWKVKPLK